MPHPLTHGIDTYFGEFFANRRRVATVLLAVSAVLAGVVALTGRRFAREVFDDPKRFGFEGPKQWVERIRLEEMATHESAGLFQVTYLTAESRKGGKRPHHALSQPQALPIVVKHEGTGEDEQDL